MTALALGLAGALYLAPFAVMLTAIILGARWIERRASAADLADALTTPSPSTTADARAAERLVDERMQQRITTHP